MATRIRNKSWTHDKDWRKRYEIIADKFTKKRNFTFMVRDFGEYAWSLRSLDRRLSYFNIHSKNKSVSVEDVNPLLHNVEKWPNIL